MALLKHRESERPTPPKLDDFSLDTVVALRCHHIEPTFADIIDTIIENEWKYTIELIDSDDGLLHVATIRGFWRARFQILGRGHATDLCDALAGAVVAILDERKRAKQEADALFPLSPDSPIHPVPKTSMRGWLPRSAV